MSLNLFLMAFGSISKTIWSLVIFLEISFALFGWDNE